jgi:hypothetical protein
MRQFASWFPAHPKTQPLCCLRQRAFLFPILLHLSERTLDHLPNRRDLTERLHEFTLWVHEIYKYRMVHQVIIRRLCSRWCGEVDSVRFAGRFDSLERTGQRGEARVKVLEVSFELRRWVTGGVNGNEQRVSDDIALLCI